MDVSKYGRREFQGGESAGKIMVRHGFSDRYLKEVRENPSDALDNAIVNHLGTMIIHSGKAVAHLVPIDIFDAMLADIETLNQIRSASAPKTEPEKGV